MNIKEAIETLKKQTCNGVVVYGSFTIDGNKPPYDEAVDTLEKETKILIPRYPKIFSCPETRYEPAEYDCDCPSCGSSILHDGEDDEWSYCPYCGQALKYESEEYY